MKMLKNYEFDGKENSNKDELLESVVRKHFSRADDGAFRRLSQQNIIKAVEKMAENLMGEHKVIAFPDGITWKREKMSNKLEDKLNEIYFGYGS